MSFFQKIKNKLSGKPRERVSIATAAGYDLWSEQYDSESMNLMVALDEELFPALLDGISLKNKVILDIGCGTGRHWAKLRRHAPLSLTGFDISQGMLDQLKKKYPDADARLMKDYGLNGIADHSVDLIVSTLAFAHFQHIESVMKTWGRVLKPGGDMIITDAHPVSFTKGADITFGNDSKTYEVAHYIYPLEMVRQMAKRIDLEEVAFLERSVDPSVKHYYASQHALATYDRFEGVPLIYGIHFRKQS